jgi:hypothetical protein
MLIGSRMRRAGLFVFGMILFGGNSTFGQLPTDAWSPIHYLGRMQGIGWGDGYHSCPTTQTSDTASKHRIRHSASSIASVPTSSSWLPKSSMSTLHSRPSESSVYPVTPRFRSEHGSFNNASSDRLNSAHATNDEASMPGNISGALQRPMKHAAMEAKCGPLFGFCPENTPLFGHLAPTSQAATLGQASPIGQADARTQTRKLDSGSQTIQPPESAQPLESAAHLRIPASR